MAPTLALSTWIVVPPVSAQPQTEQQTNPLAGDAKAIEQGRNMFRGRCAVCHGMDAKGYRGTGSDDGRMVARRQ